jgi:hypothetical protein
MGWSNDCANDDANSAHFKHFPSLSGLFTSSSSRGPTAAAAVDEPPFPSSSSAFAYEQAFHQTVGRPYGQPHMAKLRAEFESFVAEKGEEDGLRSLVCVPPSLPPMRHHFPLPHL